MMWGEGLWWVPTAAVAAIAMLGFVTVAVQPSRPGKKYWLAAIMIGAALGIGASAWQQAKSRVALGEGTARLQQLGNQLDDLGRLLPAGPGTTPDQTFDTVAAGIASLNARIKELEAQIHALAEKSRARMIEPDTATKIAEYLRPFGSHRVVVSSAPDDVEAFGYANQIANLLRASGWDALGPETTKIFGEAPAMKILVYVRAGLQPPEAAKILLDAFARFNIPVQSGITPEAAIPDPATVELFVAHKP
jgi:hypothetical protein